MSMTSTQMGIGLIALIFAVLGAGIHQASAGEVQGVTFSAMLIDADSGDPIARAWITLDGLECAESNSSGQLEWSRAVPREALLRVRHKCYVESKISVPISPTAEAIPVTLTPHADSGIVRIECLDDSGASVANATVFVDSLKQPTASAYAFAGRPGRVSVRVPSGKYRIHGSAEGFDRGIAMSSNSQTVASGIEEFTVRCDESQDLRVVFDRQAIIDGQVAGASSGPASLEITSFARCRDSFPGCGGVGMIETYPIRIDAKGCFRASIAAGSGVIQVSRKGQTSSSMRFDVRPGERVALNFSFP